MTISGKYISMSLFEYMRPSSQLGLVMYSPKLSNCVTLPLLYIWESNSSVLLNERKCNMHLDGQKSEVNVWQQKEIEYISLELLVTDLH